MSRVPSWKLRQKARISSAKGVCRRFSLVGANIILIEKAVSNVKTQTLNSRGF